MTDGPTFSYSSLGLFFIIDWFTDPPTLLFGKLKKKLNWKSLYFIPSSPNIYSHNNIGKIKTIKIVHLYLKKKT